MQPEPSPNALSTWETALNGATEEPSPEVECQMPSTTESTVSDRYGLNTVDPALVHTTPIDVVLTNETTFPFVAPRPLGAMLPCDSELARVAETADGSCLIGDRLQVCMRTTRKAMTIHLDGVREVTDEGQEQDTQNAQVARARALSLPADIRRAHVKRPCTDDLVAGGSAELQPQVDGQVHPLSELEQTLAATTHQKYPETHTSAGATGGCATETREQDNQDSEVAASENTWRQGPRFDFGVGLMRCSSCASRLPRLNRGCSQCNMRVCRQCFPNHVCEQLQGVRELATEDVRSTPLVIVM